MSNTESTTYQYIEGLVPGDYDVVCARDKDSRNNDGNKFYEKLVGSRLKEYQQNLPAQGDTPQEKSQKRERRTKIREEVKAEVQGRGGRFVRKDDEGRWYLVQECGNEGVNEKVRRALSAKKRLKAVLAKEESEAGVLFEVKNVPEQHQQGAVNSVTFDRDYEELKRKQEAAYADPGRAEQSLRGDLQVDIETLNPQDVLFGRGSGSFKHYGNTLMKKMIEDNLVVRRGLKNQEKSRLTTSIVHAVLLSGGRFLNKDKASGLWNEVKLKVAIRKVAQCFRDQESVNEAPEGKDLSDNVPEDSYSTDELDSFWIESDRESVDEALEAEQRSVNVLKDSHSTEAVGAFFIESEQESVNGAPEAEQRSVNVLKDTHSLDGFSVDLSKFSESKMTAEDKVLQEMVIAGIEPQQSVERTPLEQDLQSMDISSLGSTMKDGTDVLTVRFSQMSWTAGSSDNHNQTPDDILHRHGYC